MNKGKQQRYAIIFYSYRGEEICNFRLIRNPYFINQAVKKDSKSNRWDIISSIRARVDPRSYVSWDLIEILDEKGSTVKAARVSKSDTGRAKTKLGHDQSEPKCDCGCYNWQDGMYCKKCSYHGQKKFERNWA